MVRHRGLASVPGSRRGVHGEATRKARTLCMACWSAERLVSVDHGDPTVIPAERGDEPTTTRAHRTRSTRDGAEHKNTWNPGPPRAQSQMSHAACVPAANNGVRASVRSVPFRSSRYASITSVGPAYHVGARWLVRWVEKIRVHAERENAARAHMSPVLHIDAVSEQESNDIPFPASISKMRRICLLLQ